MRPEQRNIIIACVRELIVLENEYELRSSEMNGIFQIPFANYLKKEPNIDAELLAIAELRQAADKSLVENNLELFLSVASQYLQLNNSKIPQTIAKSFQRLTLQTAPISQQNGLLVLFMLQLRKALSLGDSHQSKP